MKFRKCEVPNCKESHAARGYCQAHYMQSRRGEVPGLKGITRRGRPNTPRVDWQAREQAIYQDFYTGKTDVVMYSGPDNQGVVGLWRHFNGKTCNFPPTGDL